MSNENELKRLEGFISKLLQNFNELKAENGRLNSELEAREETINSLKDQLAANDMERSEIGSRVSTIIDQIEEWENQLGDEVLDDVPINDASRQGNLFSAVKGDSKDLAETEAEEQSGQYDSI